MNTLDENHLAMVDDETRLEEYIAALERLLKTRDEMLEVIPPCPVHGNQCVPHALEWIKNKKDERKLVNMDEKEFAQRLESESIKLRKWYEHELEKLKNEYQAQLKGLTEKLVSELVNRQ